MIKKVEKVMELNLPTRKGTWRASLTPDTIHIGLGNGIERAITLRLTEWAMEATKLRMSSRPDSHILFCGTNPIRINVEEVHEVGHDEPSGVWIRITVGTKILSQAFINGVMIHPITNGVVKVLSR